MTQTTTTVTTKKAKTPVALTRKNAIWNFRTAGNKAPIANKMRATLRYAQQVPLNATTSPVGHTFALNGLYDPDISGVGHQPMGFDQYMAFYQKYRVNKVKVNAWFVNDTDASTSCQYVGLQIHENSGWSPADCETILERGRCCFKPVGPRTSSLSAAHLAISWDAEKWYDASKDGEYQGTSSANPVEICYVTAWAAGDFPAENPDAIAVMVILDFDVTFLNPLQMAPS